MTASIEFSGPQDSRYPTPTVDQVDANPDLGVAVRYKHEWVRWTQAKLVLKKEVMLRIWIRVVDLVPVGHFKHCFSY